MTVSPFYTLKRLYKQKPARKWIFGNATVNVDGRFCNPHSFATIILQVETGI